MGFDGARVDRIAVKSNVSKYMLYYYFKSKQNLFVETLEKMYEDLRIGQQNFELGETDPAAALRKLIRHTFDVLEKNPHIMLLLNEGNKHKGKYVRKSERVRELYDPLIASLSRILGTGHQQGIFRADLDPLAVYLTFSSLCYHFLSNRYTLEIALHHDFGTAEARERWLDHVTTITLMYCKGDQQSSVSRTRASARLKAAAPGNGRAALNPESGRR